VRYQWTFDPAIGLLAWHWPYRPQRLRKRLDGQVAQNAGWPEVNIEPEELVARINQIEWEMQ
jgi:hypothetical protein